MINIEKIIKGREGKTLEFKRDMSSLKPIMKTLVAFANTAGGILIIGREDDGTIRGVSDALQVEESLSSAISESIAPAMMPEIEIFSIEGRQLFLLFHMPGKKCFPMGASYSLPLKNTEINISLMPVSVVQDSGEQTNQIL